MPGEEERAEQVRCVGGCPVSVTEKGRFGQKLEVRKLVILLRLKTHQRVPTWFSEDANPDMLENRVCVLNLPTTWSSKMYPTLL